MSDKRVQDGPRAQTRVKPTTGGRPSCTLANRGDAQRCLTVLTKSVVGFYVGKDAKANDSGTIAQGGGFPSEGLGNARKPEPSPPAFLPLGQSRCCVRQWCGCYGADPPELREFATEIMGRRALRKTDPKLDLSSYLLTFEDLPDPWDGAGLFGRSAPLEVEVGSGKGLFMRTAAEARPDVDFLGIEVAKKYAHFAAAGLAKRGLTNGKMVAGDGLRVFSALLPSDSLQAVHVYFPDPWWKARHKKRRVLTAPFLRDVYRTLQPGGALHFWTDVQEYYESTLELLRELALLKGPLEVPEALPEHDLDYRTHFERRTRQNGEAVFRSEFEKPK